MFWFEKNNQDVLFMDNRTLHDTLCDGRKLDIEPDIIGDFRNIPFDDNTFYMVVFDPPHLLEVGKNSWLAKKYGRLSENWPDDLKQGFSECMRVLKPYGTLVFKWNEQQIKLSEILEVTDYKPLFGNKRSDTHWLVFMKEGKGHGTALPAGVCEPEYLGENIAIGCRAGKCRCGNIARSYQNYCDSCGAKLDWGNVHA